MFRVTSLVMISSLLLEAVLTTSSISLNLLHPEGVILVLVSCQGIVLSQGVTLPIQRHVDPLEIGVAIKYNTKHVKGLPLRKIRTPPHRGHRGNLLIFLDPDFYPKAIFAGDRVEMIDDFKTGECLAALHAEHIREELKLQVRFMLQKPAYPDKGILRNDMGDLPPEDRSLKYSPPKSISDLFYQERILLRGQLFFYLLLFHASSNFSRLLKKSCNVTLNEVKGLIIHCLSDSSLRA